MRKKCQAVMLPTDEQSVQAGRILMDNQTQELFPCSFGQDLTDNYTPYHLYIVSDDEIKKGDWCIHYWGDSITGSRLQEVVKVESTGAGGIHYLSNTMCLGRHEIKDKLWKIIATTDNLEIKIKTNNVYNPVTNTFSNKWYLPRPSKEFIKKYCEKNGDIEEVWVEYEGIGWDDTNDRNPIYQLQINLDNTISISSVEESWNREEVIELIKAYDCYCRERHVISVEKWVKENL